MYERELDLERFSSSCLLLGPRMTGKTSLLNQLKSHYFLDLLIPENELSYGKEPRRFWSELQALKPGQLAIVDEVQRVPALLDYVQKGIEELGIRFLLTGSSARKLRRGAANLLGGRALDLRLHPLSLKELGKTFQLSQALSFGTLPKIWQLLSTQNSAEVFLTLRSYLTVYLKEEIQAEAIVRQLGAFQRFLDVAAQSNGQMIEYDNIARECQVSASTVKDYYEILEDTLFGSFLWPYNRSERKKSRPKFYFFDCGVVRAIQERLTSKPSSEELGYLFETWFYNELRRIRDYTSKEHRISLWREARWKVDFFVERSQKPLLAIECKSGRHLKKIEALRAFKVRFPKVPLIVASMTEERKQKLEDGIEVWPYSTVLEHYRKM